MSFKEFMAPFVVVLCVLGLGFGFYFYFHSELYTRQQLISETNQILKQQNHTKMRQVATNRKTYQELKSASANSKVTGMTDSQGGDAKSMYFVGKINHNYFGFTIKNTHNLTWKIDQIKAVS